MSSGYGLHISKAITISNRHICHQHGPGTPPMAIHHVLVPERVFPGAEYITLRGIRYLEFPDLYSPRITRLKSRDRRGVPNPINHRKRATRCNGTAASTARGRQRKQRLTTIFLLPFRLHYWWSICVTTYRSPCIVQQLSDMPRCSVRSSAPQHGDETKDFLMSHLPNSKTSCLDDRVG